MMIEKELEFLRQTEQACRDMAVRTEEKKQEILYQAKKEASLEKEKILQGAHKEGEGYIKEAAAKIKALKSRQLKDIHVQQQQIQESGLKRLDSAVDKIFERMWSNGHHGNEQL